jgi:hypothetical protein
VTARYEIGYFNSIHLSGWRFFYELECPHRKSEFASASYDHRTLMDFPKTTCARESSRLQLQKLDHPTSGLYAADHKSRFA